jgi:hypothetical protein
MSTPPEWSWKQEATGGKHRTCAVDMIYLNLKDNMATTPACMLGPGIRGVVVDMEKLVAKVGELAKKKQGEWVRRKQRRLEVLPARGW